MDFDDFLEKAWADHAEHALEVAERLPLALNLVTDPEQIVPLAGLITHVYGEHLGKWDAGIGLLRQIRTQPKSEAAETITRSIASLEVASGKAIRMENFSPSYQIRILAVAASALSGKDAHRAQNIFRKAISKAEVIDKGDPANRSLAIAGNNLAASLEEKEGRSKSEAELMVLAARTARQFWEIAGTWLNVERAEYRLSQSLLKAGFKDEALKHAKTCLEICESNQAKELEKFFAYEVIALCYQAKGDGEALKEGLAQMHKLYNSVSETD